MPSSSSGAKAPAIVYFRNDSQDQADVYAVVSGSQPVRIGTVFSNWTDTLTVPGDVAARGSNVSVVARLLARSNVPSTGPLAIQPGDRLDASRERRGYGQSAKTTSPGPANNAYRSSSNAR
ncbi:MAG TPA: hypothetical protein VM076_03265 [Gemmatimonadaceae bacterium]|nr:hypothetical protein [Gemmatimonadaceae bacterium]